MGTVFTILVSVLVFGFLIFIHEFGHYITARIFKVTINEFSIGFGPDLVSYESKKTGIKYKLAMLPIGGYVAMAGENEESDDPNAFNRKPAWQRFIITAAGAAVNVIVGFLVMIVIVAFIQIGNTTYHMPVDDATLAERYENIDTTYRSSDYGLIEGDEIVSINGKKISIADELSYYIMRYGNEPVDITVKRNGETVTLPDVRFPTINNMGQVFGVADFYITGLKEKNVFSVFSLAFRKAVLVMRMCWESIADLISGRYTVEAVSGPIGISSAIGDAAKQGVLSLLNIAVIISINLGFMNLLPIPALDGGRLLTILIEMITRKKIPERIEGMINTVGLVALLILSVLIMFKDIIRIIF